MSKIFLDTNILIYALDQSDPKKQKKARTLLNQINETDQPVISTQVMQEFYVTATKKLNAEHLIIKDIIHSLKQYEIILIEPELIEQAIDCSIIHKTSFWDALIIVSAEKGNCEQLWTEDLNHGQIIRGVQIHNPLK